VLEQTHDHNQGEERNMKHEMTASLAVSIVGATFAASAHDGAGSKPTQEFETASICVERNATDRDTEILLQAVPADDGLKHFSVRAPDGRRVFRFDSVDPTVLGMREFALESPEPAGERILAAYPQGRYSFTGRTHTGESFLSTARLSHRMPEATVILEPTAEAEVPTSDLLIRWSAVPGVSHYLLELENESADPEQSLNINLPAEVSSFLVPAAWLQADSEYQIGVATVSANCNVVFIESVFRTAE
jgi:hypothetical protein